MIFLQRGGGGIAWPLRILMTDHAPMLSEYSSDDKSFLPFIYLDQSRDRTPYISKNTIEKSLVSATIKS